MKNKEYPFIEETALQSPEKIIVSLLELRDMLHNRLAMQDSDTTNLRPVLTRINTCLYGVYRGHLRNG